MQIRRTACYHTLSLYLRNADSRLCGCVFALLQCNPNLQLLVWHMAKELYVRISSGFFFAKERDMRQGSAEQALPRPAATVAPFVPQARGKAFIIATDGKQSLYINVYYKSI